VSVYQNWVLPRLTDLVMRNAEATRYRSQVVPFARGTVLEVGAGSGLNLKFYGAAVERLYALDPSEELLGMARRRAAEATVPVEFLLHSGEEIPLEDRSCDTVVTTWTLCTIPDPAQALSEMKRVLKQGGTLLFAEHGAAPEARVRGWQERLNPLWRRMTGGCNLNRSIATLMADAGFTVVNLQREYAKGLRPMSYIYFGNART
jgi:ubiquinone/menaquinone biosynthesis C-methylase UbiE